MTMALKPCALALIVALHAGPCQAAHPLREQARQLAAQARYPDALAAYGRLLADFPGDAELLVEAAQASGYADRNEEARWLYRRAMLAAPDRRAEWLLPYAWQTLWSGHAEEAVGLFSEAGLAAPAGIEALRGHAEACAALDRHGCAELQWRAVLQRRPDDAAAALGLGFSLLWQDRHAEAAQQFQSLLLGAPGHARARLGLAQSYNFAGRHRAAVAQFERMAAEDGSAGEIPAFRRIQAARAYYWAGFPDLAMPLLDAAQKLPRDAGGRWLRDYRVGRELQPQAWGALDGASDADGLRSQAWSAGASWPGDGSGAGRLDVSARRLQLRGEDRPLQAMYGDLVRADGDGLLQALAERSALLQGAVASAQYARGMQLAEALGAALPDKFAAVLGRQRVDGVPGLGQVQALLDSPGFARLRQLAQQGDQAGLWALLQGGEGAAMLDHLRRAAQQARQARPAGPVRLHGEELLASQTWRLGGVQHPAGTLWASLGLGLRDYGGWRTAAWRARARYVPADLWLLEADAGNGAIETPGALRNHVRYRSASVALRHAFTPEVGLALSAALLRFDDGNLRRKLAWRVDYLAWHAARLRLGWEGNGFGDTRPWQAGWRDRGYYNPLRYREDRLFASVEGEAGRWSWFAKAGAGRYRETVPGTTAGDAVSEAGASAAEGALAYDAAPGLQWRFNAGRSNSAAAAGGGHGYWRNYAGLKLTGWF